MIILTNCRFFCVGQFSYCISQALKTILNVSFFLSECCNAIYLVFPTQLFKCYALMIGPSHAVLWYYYLTNYVLSPKNFVSTDKRPQNTSILGIFIWVKYHIPKDFAFSPALESQSRICWFCTEPCLGHCLTLNFCFPLKP